VQWQAATHVRRHDQIRRYQSHQSGKPLRHGMIQGRTQRRIPRLVPVELGKKNLLKESVIVSPRRRPTF
jgi:hypothetical protein